MKVLCIGKCNPKSDHPVLLKALEDIKIGERYNVVHSETLNKEFLYELAEFKHPYRILWEAKNFIPISDVDETEMIREYKTELV